MTWHNLPCSPTLAAISATCPRGWIEFTISHYSGDSGPGGNTPQEPDTFADNGRIWGIDSDDQQEMWALWKSAGFEPETFGKGVPNGATVLARVERAPLRCNQCGGPCNAETMYCAEYREDGDEPGCIGLAIIELALVTTWGGGGKPVYWTGEGAPDYSGQQAAPKPGQGDMWASLIRWAEERHATAALIERMKDRRQLGIERYGTPLQASNGRDVVRDVLEETLDRMAYLEQLGHERPFLWHTIKAVLDQDLGVAELMVGIASGSVLS